MAKHEDDGTYEAPDTARQTVEDLRRSLEDGTPDEDYLAEQTNYQRYIVENFSPDIVRKLRRISYLMSRVGLPLGEAIYHIGYTKEQIETLFSRHPVMKEFLRSKELEYKKDLLAAISVKGRTDEKTAMWLLEKRFPEEFNKKKGSDAGDASQEDTLAGIMDLIQSGGVGAPLVHAPAPHEEERAASAEALRRRISEIMV